MNLYLLKFNNYYNRIVKKFDTLAEYLVTPYYNNDVVENVNFNPNDGVDTEQIINSNGKFDYCILSDGITIESRWFIIECKRERNGQYRLTLRRDLVADNYNSIINAPTFIEKATVSNSDPAIFNNENMGFNQIKTSETLLKDETGCAWIVGYYARSDGNAITTLSGTTTRNFPVDIEVPSSIETWEYYKYTTQDFVGVPTKLNFITNVTLNKSINYVQYIVGTDNYTKSGTTSRVQLGRLQSTTPFIPVSEFKEALNLSQIIPLAKYYGSYASESEFNDFYNMDGKIVRATSGSTYKYYKVNISVINKGFDTVDLTSGNLPDTMRDNIVNNTKITRGNTTSGYDSDTFKMYYEAQLYRISLEEQTNLETKYNITATRYHLEDNPYDIFAIPYSDDLTIYNGANVLCKANKQLAFSTAMSIAEQQGSKIYDIQLLPYCPVRNIIQEDGTMNVNGNNLLYSTITEGDNVVGVIFNGYTSTDTLSIQKNIIVSDYKESNECDLYRLVSPNYNGQFEFSVAKNGGVTRFDVDFTYLPYKPYIHVNPAFSRLYGQEFDDARGLICGGDFSLPIINDQWKAYQINNKNYQNIFDRQIQNMEINNRLSNIQSGVGALAGAVSAGGAAGLIFGPLAGVGAGVFSAIGGGADFAMNKALQNEALDYKKDMFGYELGNIKAMPDSLAKVTAFTANNKVFPMLEYYTCTDEEKQALKDKIKYNGMTVMRIGKIVDFLQEDYSYIKGKVIRLDDIADDTNYLNQIADEIYKGVFIK